MMNEHLRDVNMTYFQHLVFAWKCGLALLIHGLFPTVLKQYASDKLQNSDNTHKS